MLVGALAKDSCQNKYLAAAPKGGYDDTETATAP